MRWMPTCFRWPRLALVAVTLALPAVSASRPAPAPDPQSAAEKPAAAGVIHQLRIYEIFDSNKQAFHDRFRDHALRIMGRHQFHVLATWESRRDGRTEFVYLLEWPDEATKTARWAEFMADTEWIDIKKRTGANGPLVGEIQDRTLHLTPYTPGVPSGPG